MLGGIETRTRPNSFSRAEQIEVRSAAATLNITPSIYKGGPAWFAINAYGPGQSESESRGAEYSRNLPQQHPLTTLSAQSDTQLSLLAAALARPALALQLQAGASDGDSRHLLEIAKNSARFTPARDLSEILRHGVVMEYGTSPLPERHEIKKPRGQRAGKDALAEKDAAKPSATEENADVSVYVDGRRLQVERNKILGVTELTADAPGRLFFFDVPLSGNTQLAVKALSNGEETPSLRIIVLDQTTGGEIGSGAISLANKEAAEITLPLHQLWGKAAIAMELRGEGKVEVTLDVVIE
jgi:hypothetical protein